MSATSEDTSAEFKEKLYKPDDDSHVDVGRFMTAIQFNANTAYEHNEFIKWDNGHKFIDCKQATCNVR